MICEQRLLFWLEYPVLFTENVAKAGILALFLILEEMFLVFTIEYDVIKTMWYYHKGSYIDKWNSAQKETLTFLVK